MDDITLVPLYQESGRKLTRKTLVGRAIVSTAPILHTTEGGKDYWGERLVGFVLKDGEAGYRIIDLLQFSDFDGLPFTHYTVVDKKTCGSLSSDKVAKIESVVVRKDKDWSEFLRFCEIFA